MRKVIKVFVVATALLSFAAGAKQVQVSKELQAAMDDIAVHSQVVLVPDPRTTAANFKEDSDPATLQIVVLAKPSDGPDHVSDDGEVIFVHKNTSSAKQQSFFQTAFYLKAKAREASGQQPAPAHSSS